MILIFLHAFLIFALKGFLYNAHKQIQINERRRKMKHPVFIDEYGSFSIEQPENTSYLYFPLASETGLKSSVTPDLGGDSKIDQETFLLEPVSAENLHNNRSVRNFWIVCGPGKVFSAAGASADSCGTHWKEFPVPVLSAPESLHLSPWRKTRRSCTSPSGILPIRLRN